MSTPPAPIIPFTKASACGNDFLIVDGGVASGDLGAISRRLCDRHNGIGADGVEWLFPDDQADASVRLFNADGSEAEVSGNGTRCVAAWLYSKKQKSEVIIRTGAGLKTFRLTGQHGVTYEFEADMGESLVEEPSEVALPDVRVRGTKVSMGNPHFVIFVDGFQSGWQQQAASIAAQPVFSQGTNVEYVVTHGPHEIEIRLFERGVGETLSSGTGSCASAVAAIAGKRVSSPVKVIAPGGVQTVRWEGRVYLTGPATIIGRGEFFV
jgi:diaminopimelate epimerase